MGSPLLLLKKGSEAPPFFITHGLGGRVTELSKIVQALDTGGSVYGMQWRGWDGQEPPRSSIEEMAADFTDAIVASFPSGPYLLSGLSMGGLVVLEVARQLTKRNCDVALLALLDTYPHPHYWPIGSWISTMARRAMYHGFMIAKMPLGRAISELRYRYRAFGSHLRSRRGLSTLMNTSDVGTFNALQKMQYQAFVAFTQYKPSFYSGKITFLKADKPTRFPKDASKLWGKLARELEIHRFPCDHTALASTHAEFVARRLSVCIEHALNRSLTNRPFDPHAR